MWESCDPMDCSPLGSSVYGISQAKILEWFAISFSRRSSPPKDRTLISCLIGGFFTTKPLLQPPDVPDDQSGTPAARFQDTTSVRAGLATILWFFCSLPASPHHPWSSQAGNAGTPFLGPSSVFAPHQLSLCSLPCLHQLSR